MYSYEEHLDNLVRHIELVREACLLLGKRLMRNGKKDFGRLLIARGFVHDASKFYGIEWNFLHIGPEVAQEKLDLAIEQHQETNEHHVEFWGSIDAMPELALAEMVCDWYARSQEFGTDLRSWIQTVAFPKFSPNKRQEKLIWKFVNILLKNSFKS